ncbi:hypothetical protein BDM02DRAFT_3123236 [Thelephora ganbajun]|uniref:Uncharacterized protein n=1 Tax=Thelephora ganbajun TaxID=370292 RepID=A0ACB6Z2S8_THEGA|nr:hypothetical protein BDM02DRAFT_3123236 [Thelephora ganbajun]
MGGMNLAVLVQIGKSMCLFATSMHWLWVYDYFLTLGDEIKYAWSGRKSWSEYIPLLHVIYKGIIFCQRTKWEVHLYMTIITVLAQMTIALRVFAVTQRNKLVGGAFSVLIFAEFCFGTGFIVRTTIRPLQSLPEINLDAYKACFFERWRVGELSFTAIAAVFDISAFLTILVTARGKGHSMTRYPGTPNILDIVLRDATLYFLLVCACLFVLLLFLSFAPVSDVLVPIVAHAMFLPIMASRLMLSLKKAATEPNELWSFSTMANFDTERSPEDGTIRFVSRTFDVPFEISDTTTSPNGEDIELESIPRLPRNRGSRQQPS